MTEPDKDPIEQMLDFVKTASKEELLEVTKRASKYDNTGIGTFEDFVNAQLKGNFFNPLNHEQTK